MKLTVQKKLLLEALQTAGKAVGSSTINLLENYLFDISEERLVISGCNMLVYISCEIPAEADFSKMVAVPAAKILNLVKELTDKELTIELTEKKSENGPVYSMIVRSLHGEYTIMPVENGELFPKLKHQPESSYIMDSAAFTAAVDKTMFACAADTASTLSNVLISFVDNQATITATDAKVLSTVSFETESENDTELVLPAKAMAILRSMPIPEELTLEAGRDSVQVNFDDKTFMRAVLHDSKYPPYKSIIPLDNPVTVSINRQELIAALKRLGQFTDPATHTVRLDISAEKLIVYAVDVEGDLAHEQISHKHQGGPLIISFSARALLSCLGKMYGTELAFSFSTPNKAALLRETDCNEQKSNLMLIMPLMI